MLNHNKLKDLVENSNYDITQINGQRVYGLRSNTIEPPKGCEVFVGKLPRDMFEDELVPLFSKIAPIYQLRIMVDFMGYNRGYCFVRYFCRQAAEIAIRRLNHHYVRANAKLGVYWSLDNTRLFVGGLPTNKTKDEIMEMLQNFMDDIKDIIMYPSYVSHLRNRGYAFLEFENHRAAAIARRQIPPGSLLWDMPIRVDWADPLPDPDPQIMSQVSTLYMRNIPMHITGDELVRQLKKNINCESTIKVHKTLDYAFVHFASPKIAERCMKYLILQNFAVGGQIIEVSWARPQLYSKKSTQDVTPNHYCMSLPARSRWLIKKKNQKRLQALEKYDDSDSRTRTNTPLFFLPRDEHLLRAQILDRNPELLKDLGSTSGSASGSSF